MPQNPIIYLTRKTWQYTENKRKLLFIAVLFLCANLVAFFEPLIVGLILNTVQLQGVNDNSFGRLLGLLSLFLLIEVAFWAFHGPARVMERANGFLVRNKYKQYLLDGTMSLPSDWHTDHHSGDTIDKIEKGSSALYQYSSRGYEVIETVLRFIGSYIALSYFNLHSSYIVLGMVIFTVMLINRFDRKLIGQYKELNRAENKISAKVYDVISNISTVIILRIEQLVSRMIVKRMMAPFRLFSKNVRLDETKWFLVSMSSAIMTFLVVGSYLYLTVRGNELVLVGTVSILYGYVSRISNLFFRFAFRYGDIVRQRTAVMNAEEISNEFKTKKRQANHSLKEWKELAISRLNFSYHTKEGTNLQLRNVNLNIRRGERIALIGESGSGKTTLLKVIRELYQTKDFNLKLDGQNLNDFGDISQEIALIPQDPEIFSTTIKENITMGINYNLKQIKKYTDIAQFSSVIQRLPHNLNSYINEKGVNLSGGEKQRLALSRGLMASSDKSILLLDEPTSSVDSKNELMIFKRIFHEFKNQTILVSVHRLHLLSMFEKIVYFDKGKIIAQGTLKEMLENNRFRKLWNEYSVK